MCVPKEKAKTDTKSTSAKGKGKATTAEVPATPGDTTSAEFEEPSYVVDSSGMNGIEYINSI